LLGKKKTLKRKSRVESSILYKIVGRRIYTKWWRRKKYGKSFRV